MLFDHDLCDNGTTLAEKPIGSFPMPQMEEVNKR
jgi:hypothetical protein